MINSDKYKSPINTGLFDLNEQFSTNCKDFYLLAITK